MLGAFAIFVHLLRVYPARRHSAGVPSAHGEDSRVPLLRTLGTAHLRCDPLVAAADHLVTLLNLIDDALTSLHHALRALHLRRDTRTVESPRVRFDPLGTQVDVHAALAGHRFARGTFRLHPRRLAHPLLMRSHVTQDLHVVSPSRGTFDHHHEHVDTLRTFRVCQLAPRLAMPPAAVPHLSTRSDISG